MEIFEEVIRGLGLSPRAQQVELVRLARLALTDNDQRFVQAGTGTGKSFAALSVALEASRTSGLPSVVVCPNNALIDQYVVKDAPSVGRVASARFAHIKGRSRYVCASSFTLSNDPMGEYKYFELVKGGQLEWAKLGLDESYGCPGSDECDPRAACKCGAYQAPGRRCECPYVCGAFEARLLAEDAEVVITNAHVLVWDHLIQQYTDGNVRLLPEFGALFIDECHELEGVGRGCLSEEISEKSPTVALIPGLGKWIRKQIKRLAASGETEALLHRDEEVEEMARWAEEKATRVEQSADGETKQGRRMIKRLRKFVDFASASDDFISFIDVSNVEKAFLRRRCVNAGGMFNQILTGQPSVLISGTIPASDRRRLGLSTAPIKDVGHPFDYSKSSLIVSKYSPKDRADLSKRVNSAVRAINQTKGGTLMLFTSWADLEEVMPRVAHGLNDGIDVYVQSREEPATLPQDIADFKADGNAVLAGVRSLFTGLDIPGPALRQVIIWKLPYQVPTFEVKAIQSKFGRGVYSDQMLMTLVQGIGRLIRTTEDEGRVLIMDSRASKLHWDSNGMTHHLDEFRSRT